MLNALIHVEAIALKNIMSAASEPEIAGACVNAKVGILLRIALLEMGHPQEVTPLEIDKTTACDILSKQLVPRRSKSIGMGFFWLCDRNNKQQFHTYWDKGRTNIGDYYTKHHPSTHHQKMRPLHMTSNVLGTNNQMNLLGTINENRMQDFSDFIRGCVDPHANNAMQD